MQEFEARPKKWGSSLGVIIPKEIVEEEKITTKKKIRFLIAPPMENVKKSFGTLKLKKPTQQLMDEIDEGYDE
ncbi:hypothetical protein HYS50_01130 [Candidatus Woesearchaeota archaeon]|nr:hypothetical protein [Candidatus Woesearchaeota archaeon]